MMKRILLGTLVLIAAIGGAQATPQIAERKTVLSTDKERIGYAIGVNIGETLVLVQDRIDLDLLWQGVEDALAQQTLISLDEAKEITGQFRQVRQEALEKKRLADAARAAEAGRAYQAENAKRPGVVTTASGLQYEVLVQGDGPVPTAENRVVVHYRGTLVDGTVFDSSYDRSDPSVFGVNQVIPGWTEALTMMPVGSKWRLVIPAELAYKEKGFKSAIGPNETLIFELELLEIK
jgi:FKBP-type peptidyl-prolyl cis-trans isomerase